jgi:ketosteroid isomerase-like protein
MSGEGTMTDNAALETVIRDIYDARMRGDVDAILRHTADDVHFAIAGCGASSAVPCSVDGRDALRDVLGHLVSAFEFSNGRVINLMIDRDRAFVHWRVQVRAPASGQEAETELVDLVQFAGDKVRSFTQFADTALASRLLQA